MAWFKEQHLIEEEEEWDCLIVEVKLNYIKRGNTWKEDVLILINIIKNIIKI
jgi:hypothetical protein